MGRLVKQEQDHHLMRRHVDVVIFPKMTLDIRITLQTHWLIMIIFGICCKKKYQLRLPTQNPAIMLGQIELLETVQMSRQFSGKDARHWRVLGISSSGPGRKRPRGWRQDAHVQLETLVLLCTLDVLLVSGHDFARGPRVFEHGLHFGGILHATLGLKLPVSVTITLLLGKRKATLSL